MLLEPFSSLVAKYAIQRNCFGDLCLWFEGRFLKGDHPPHNPPSSAPSHFTPRIPCTAHCPGCKGPVQPKTALPSLVHGLCWASFFLPMTMSNLTASCCRKLKVCSNYGSPVVFYAIVRLTDILSDPFDFSSSKTG